MTKVICHRHPWYSKPCPMCLIENQPMYIIPKEGQVDEKIEKAITEGGHNKGPRVTMGLIEGAINEIAYQRVPDTNVTICVLVLSNGFTVMGNSACVSDANFDEQIGREVAYDDALDKCWELFGMVLACVESGDYLGLAE